MNNCKFSMAMSFTLTVFSSSQVDTSWVVVDSWAEVGVIIGIVITCANFAIMVYERFFKKHHDKHGGKHGNHC